MAESNDPDAGAEGGTNSREEPVEATPSGKKTGNGEEDDGGAGDGAIWAAKKGILSAFASEGPIGAELIGISGAAPDSFPSTMSWLL